MEEKKNLEIQIISNETIKPTSPTPPHLRTFKLSLIDQIFPAFHVPLLLFYNTPTLTPPHQLKSSLADTLSCFYPLAGRCIDDSTVACSDQGIPFVEARVSFSLSEFLTLSDKVRLLQQLLPPRGFLALGPRPISELVPLAFQVNVFACGGVVIGCYMLHKLLDTASLGTFFQHWAALASGRQQNAVGPNFDAIVKAFPPDPSIKRVAVPDLCKDPPSDSPPLVVLVKSFRLSEAGITRLKSKAASEAYQNPTSFETVAGFVWENVVAAARSTRAADSTVLSITINMRSRTSPTLPREAMGNCITEVHAKATAVTALPELVEEIHGAVFKSKKKIESFQGENGVEEICADRKAASKFVTEGDGCVYLLSSWYKLGLDKVDFGFGKPNWIIPTDGQIPPSLRNFIFFTDYFDASGDGIEVWFFLEEKEMQFLESNPKFLEFASPN
ncbi:hypothetical protein vseg_014982 [Gypsophila vaccaria]